MLAFKMLNSIPGIGQGLRSSRLVNCLKGNVLAALTKDSDIKGINRCEDGQDAADVIPLGLPYRHYSFLVGGGKVARAVQPWVATDQSQKRVLILDRNHHGLVLKRSLERALGRDVVDYVSHNLPPWRSNGTERNFTDLDYDCVVLACRPSDYVRAIRFVCLQFRKRMRILLPFAPPSQAGPGVIPVGKCDPKPIVILLYPGAASKRANPVLRQLMKWGEREEQPTIDAMFNRRYVASMVKSGILPGQPNFGHERVPLSRFDEYYRSWFDRLDDYQWTSFHHIASASMLGALKDSRVIFLHRDPRDIYCTWFHRFVYDGVGPDFDDLRALKKEDAFLRLFEGLEYVNMMQTYTNKIPPLDQLASSMAEIGQHDNIYGLRFEDIRYRPLEAYADLVSWLGWDTIPVRRDIPGLLRRITPLGTFRVQSGGRMEEGKGEGKGIFRPRPLDVTTNLRKGNTGDWRNHFSAKVKDRFKALAGQSLIDLGYEQDFEW